MRLPTLNAPLRPSSPPLLKPCHLHNAFTSCFLPLATVRFDYGDVDPNVDPELALALRVSMEEERARQEAATRKVRMRARAAPLILPLRRSGAASQRSF